MPHELTKVVMMMMMMIHDDDVDDDDDDGDDDNCECGATSGLDGTCLKK